jgi:uncharacterized protein (TIGR03086 family)
LKESQVADIRDLDRRTLAVTAEIVRGVSDDQLELPTPCAQWTLRQLVGHMIGQHYGFAAAAHGETSDLSVWADRPVGGDFRAAYAAAVSEVTAAFSADDMLSRRLWLPEIRDSGRFPAELAIGFHFLDYVVHGWDVARSVGVPVAFEADLIDEVLVRAAQVPDGEPRLAPRAAFRPGVALPQSAPPLDRVVAMLGRSPGWPD